MSLQSVTDSLPDLQEELTKFREILLANLVMIGEIPSPTFNEEERIEFLLNRFNEAGLTENSMDERGNGIGVLNGEEGDGAILLTAHADTVFSLKTDHTMQVSADKIIGPSVADNSLGLGVLATIPYILQELDIKLKHDLVLLGGVRSLGRGDLEGIRFFLENNSFNIKNALCLEGVELGRLSYTSIGMIRGEITCKVPETYDWSRFGDASAILTMNEVINKINDIRLPKRPRASIILGCISGGSSFNTIAWEATLGFEVRSESHEVVERAGKIIDDIVKEVSSKTGDEVELDIFARRRPGGIPYAHPLTKCARSVMNKLDIEPRLAPSISELSALIDKEIPALTLGITTGDRLQKMDESVKIKPIYKGLAQIIGILIATDGGFFD